MKLFKRLTASFLAVVLAIGTAAAVSAASFPDTKGHWAEESIVRAHTDGYLNGYDDGNFHPDADLTAAETIEILVKALKLPAAPTTGTSAKITKWYYQVSKAAIAAGLIERFFDDYDKPVTRGDSVLMAAKGYGFAPEEIDITVLDKFPDAAEIAEQDREAFAGLVERRILKGYDDGELHLNESLSRAEFVTILFRLMDFNEEDWRAQVEEEKRQAEEEKRRAEEAAKKAEEEALRQERLKDPNSSEYKAEKERVFNLVTSGYAGDYTTKWAEGHDYTEADKEFWVNAKGYSSSSKYLIWVNLTYQRCNIFEQREGMWKLIRSCIVGTGADGTPTPRGTWKVTYHDSVGWTTSTYTVKPVVGFKGGGYAFHSRLYYPGTTTLSSPSIGFPVSHGCVRMYDEDIQWIYDYIPDGTTVVVY